MFIDELTRDYVYGIKDETIRKAKLTPWNEDEDLDDENEDPSIQHEPDESYFLVHTTFSKVLFN